MFHHAKNGIVQIGGTEMHYAAFGTGAKALVLLPGLSDGLTVLRQEVSVRASVEAFLIWWSKVLSFEPYTFNPITSFRHDSFALARLFS